MSKAIYRCRVDKKKIEVEFNSRGIAKRPKCPKCGGSMSLKDKDVR